jgi:hypothetical protein
MERSHFALSIKTILRLIGTLLISVLSGAFTGILTAVIGSFFNIKR